MGLKKIVEGKTKILYQDIQDMNYLLYFKDDITAGDGKKHDVLKGKGKACWEINKNIFEFIRSCVPDVPTHYIESKKERYVRIKKITPLGLEVVTRRIATGSLLKFGYREGDIVWITQFFIKNDLLGDPLISEEWMKKSKRKELFGQMKEINEKVFEILEKKFLSFDLQLVDLKLEYGLDKGKIILIDEITPDTFRLWPIIDKKEYLKRKKYEKNILKILDKKNCLDKQLYREGRPLGEVLSAYKKVAEITKKFKEK